MSSNPIPVAFENMQLANILHARTAAKFLILAAKELDRLNTPCKGPLNGEQMAALEVLEGAADSVARSMNRAGLILCKPRHPLQ